MGYGTLMQQFRAGPYVGKRVRFSAYVKSENVTRWAGLFMRVDGKGATGYMALDNMRERPIKGTTEWKLYEVVLDVPESGVEMTLGIMLDGPGQVWVNSGSVEIVSSAIPVTKLSIPNSLPDGPRNLGLDH